MNKVRKLVEMLPYIANVKNADRYSKRNLMMYDVEANTTDSVWNYRNSDASNPRERLMCAEILNCEIGNLEAYEFGMDLLAFIALKHRVEKNEPIDESKCLELELSLKRRSGKTKEIQEIEDIVSISSIDYVVRGGWY